MRFEHDDPIIHARRMGNSSSPFRSMSEQLVVDSSAKVILTEMPSEFHKVIVSGLAQDWFEVIKVSLAENEFKVDYKNKIVTFHESHIGKQLGFTYKGTGLTYVPTSMIYTKRDGLTVTETIDDFVVRADDKIDETEATRQKVIKDTNSQIDKTEQSRLEMIDSTNQKIAETEIARTEALEAAGEAYQRTSDYETAVQNSTKIYKPMVLTYNDIATTYPNPEIGWTTSVEDTGMEYRWDGIEWVNTGVIDTGGFTVFVSPTPPLNVNTIWLERDVVEPYYTKVVASQLPPEDTTKIWLDRSI